MRVDKTHIDLAHDTELVELVRQCAQVELKPTGRNWSGLCPLHSEKTPSFFVYPDKNKFQCYGCDAGGDAIDFMMLHSGLQFQEAVQELAMKSAVAPRMPSGKAKILPTDPLVPVSPIPISAPPIPTEVMIEHFGNWLQVEASSTWTYRDLGGQPLFHVQRFEVQGGKTIRPLTLWRDKSSGALKWARRALPGSRPLYGLEHLCPLPNALVLMVEGEKSADAARRMFQKVGKDKEVIVMTWPGGANGLRHVDLSPLQGRAVGIWPDADEPGAEAAQELTMMLKGVASRIKRIDPPAHVPTGWDAADAEAEPGFDILKFAKTSTPVWERAAEVVALMPVSEASAPKLQPVEAILVKGQQYEHQLFLREPDIASAPMFDPLAVLPEKLPKSADARHGSHRYFALSEQGNSYRFANLAGHNIRYVANLNEFLVWRDGRWVNDQDDRVVREAIGQLSRSIKAEAAYHAAEGLADDSMHALKWAIKCESNAVIKSTLDMVKDIGRLHIHFAAINADPWLAGVAGGRQVVDLRTGLQRAAQRDDLVTYSMGIDHVGQASKAMLWEKFLRDVFCGDDELIDWFKRWVGYCLTGCYSEQIFLFLYGSGANGKSVLMKVLATMFGAYNTWISSGTLMAQQRTGKEASPDLMQMAGARLVLGSEVSEGQAFDEELLKSITGGDMQKARPLHGKIVEFEPTGKIMIAGNHRPRIVGTDVGVWRRVRLVLFKRQFEEHERDPNLFDKLLAELPDIAAWAIDGCQEWMRRGLKDTPTAVRAASGDYAKEQDTLGEFLAERTDPGGECFTQVLFDSYRAWAAGCGITRPLTRQAFGRRLRERSDITVIHDRKGALAVGLTVRRIFDRDGV